MNKTAFYDQFSKRHIGPNPEELQEMLKVIGVDSLDQLIDQTVPAGIRLEGELDLPEAVTEFEYLQEMNEIAAMPSELIPSGAFHSTCITSAGSSR